MSCGSRTAPPTATSAARPVRAFNPNATRVTESQVLARLVVGPRQAARQPVVNGVGIGEHDRHLTAQRGIRRLELDRFDDLLVSTRLSSPFSKNTIRAIRA